MDARPIFLSISDPSDFLREIRILFFFFFFLFEKRATYHRKRSLLNYSPERGADVSRWLKDGGLKLTRGIIIRKLLPLSLSLSIFLGNFFADVGVYDLRSWPRFYDVLRVILSSTESPEFIADLLSPGRETVRLLFFLFLLLLLLLFLFFLFFFVPLREDKSRKFDLNVSSKTGEIFIISIVSLEIRKINNKSIGTIEERFLARRREIKFSRAESFTNGTFIVMCVIFFSSRRRKSRLDCRCTSLWSYFGKRANKRVETREESGERNRTRRTDRYVGSLKRSEKSRVVDDTWAT